MDLTVIQNAATKIVDKFNSVDTDITRLKSRATTLEQDVAVLDGRVDTFTSLPEGATTNDAALADIAVGYDGTVYPDGPGSAVRAQISQLNSEIEDLGVKHIVDRNLFDFKQIIDGRPSSETNATYNEWEVGSEKSYVSSNLITVETGTKLVMYGFVPTTVRLYLYDKDGMFLSAGSSSWEVDENNVSHFIPVKNGLASIRVVVSKTSGFNEHTVICKESDYDGLYYEFGEYRKVELLELDDYSISKEKLKKDIFETKLNGLKMWSFGDSIANGDGNNNISYADIIAEKYNMILTKYSKGGATICKALKDSNNIYDQVLNAISNAPETPDVILLEGYTNDISQSSYEELKGSMVDISLTGSYTSQIATDGSTMCNSFEYIIQQLKLHYPSAIILFVTTHKMSSRDITRIIEAHNLLCGICEKWSVPIADIMKKGSLNTKIESMKQYTLDTTGNGDYDSTHPNFEGYNRFYVPIIEKKLLEIV